MGEVGSQQQSPVFTVRVAAPGQVVHGIVVRAASEEEARARVEARGHTVVGVRAYTGAGEESLGSSPIKCALCGYDLTRLPVGKGRNVQCPECGSVNLPIGEKRLKAGRRLARVRMFSRVLLLVITLLIVGAIATAIVGRARLIRAANGGAGGTPAGATGP